MAKMQIRLPDGSQRELEPGASAADLAAQIGPGLAKAAVAAEVNGAVVDLARPLPDGAAVRILTKKDALALEVLRHSAAHLMADAILRLFPAAQLTIGPIVEDGFYYDIHMPEGKLTPDDFPRIEEEMGRIAAEAAPFVRCEVRDPEKDEVFARYRAIDGGHNKFKLELVDDIRKRGEALSFYRHGDFVDLCRGPHVPHAGWLKHVSSWCASTARPSSTRRVSRSTCACSRRRASATTGCSASSSISSASTKRRRASRSSTRRAPCCSRCWWTPCAPCCGGGAIRR
jgi:threonyl-tRNA synthetase